MTGRTTPDRTPTPDTRHPYRTWVMDAAASLDKIAAQAKATLLSEEIRDVKTLLRRGRFLVNRQAITHNDLSFDRAEASALIRVLMYFTEDAGEGEDADTAEPPVRDDDPDDDPGISG